MLGGIGLYLSSPTNREKVLGLLGEHVYLAILPLLIGLAVALPLGALARRGALLRTGTVQASSVLYTVPSLALFVVMPGILGTSITSPANVVVSLAVYTTALLVRPVVDALDAVPGHVVAAAIAMGYRPARRFVAVELPLAVPVLAAGVRVASVSNISLVSVGALIGIGGLGELFTEGFQLRYPAPIVIGILLTLVLALVVDLLLVGLRRLATPWAHAGVGS
ncbi:MAG: ABC transporter permease subunit [Pseudonocardiaceae bacterium]|nr:ABC transporter permease subunit [Pseudonocardiaceae bacterium]